MAEPPLLRTAGRPVTVCAHEGFHQSAFVDVWNPQEKLASRWEQMGWFSLVPSSSVCRRLVHLCHKLTGTTERHNTWGRSWVVGDCSLHAQLEKQDGAHQREPPCQTKWLVLRQCPGPWLHAGFFFFFFLKQKWFILFYWS